MSPRNPDAPLPLTVADVVGFLSALAPLALAETWDNVGLLWGDPAGSVTRVMTCLTLTRDVADEAVRRHAELVVSHHPILFHPVQRVTAQTAEGALLLALARREIAVYSAHTAYDSAPEGINRQLADRLGLGGISVLRPGAANHPAEQTGAGRFGRLSTPCSLAELAEEIKTRLELTSVDLVGLPDRRIEQLAIACGSAAEFLEDAIAQGCQALLTGEARFHACVEARDRGLALILVGHFASERPAMERLAEQIRRRFPDLEVWASAAETDPIRRA